MSGINIELITDGRRQRAAYHKCEGCGADIPMRKRLCYVCSDKRRIERDRDRKRRLAQVHSPT